MEKLTLADSDGWNTACIRLEDYLRAHRVQPRDRLLELTLSLLNEARAIPPSEQEGSPVQTVMQLAISRTEAWFSRLLDDEAVPNTTLAVQGRVAYFTTSADRRWPHSFLAPEPPQEMLDAVRAASVRAGPALEFRSLIRKDMDYGAMEDIARETWAQFSWAHVLRAFVLWVAIFFIAYGVYLRFLA